MVKRVTYIRKLKNKPKILEKFDKGFDPFADFSWILPDKTKIIKEGNNDSTQLSSRGKSKSSL